MCDTTVAGNDTQVIENGDGQANAVALVAGANGVINTTPGGDDAVQAVGARAVPDPNAGHPYTAFYPLSLRRGVDAWPVTGVAGQGNADPPPAFNGHWITKWQDGATYKYFDPSYGSAVVSDTDSDDALEAYENAALAGFSGSDYTVDNVTYTSLRKNVTTPDNGKEVDEFDADAD